MIPIQYRYVSGLKEREAKIKVSQYKMYENMRFEEQQLHFSHQGNLWNVPSAIVASFIYQLRHRK
ncbi:DUF3949 domain-containing protein [Microbacteriaceae bacterium 4G12]